MNEIATNVPAVLDDGFDQTNEADRLIRGSVVRCTDGTWRDGDGNPIPPDSRWIAWAVTECLQQWRDKKPVRTILKQAGVPLPDVDELNAEIPQREWEKGLDNKPRPPWGRQVVVYLLDASTGAEMTYISSTTGGAIAVERLRRQTGNMRMLRGARVVPVISLGSKLMTTNFGSRLRPEFTVQEWREFGAPSPAIASEAGKQIAPPTLAEEMSDEIPTFD